MPTMNETELILYLRAGCHLCEDAIDILRQHGHAFRSVDIAADSGLEARYGLRIPVLTRRGQEVDWPFGPPDVEALMQRSGN